MYSRLINPPARKSFFLLGPRGTGKTTWTRQTFPEAVFVDLLEAEIFNDLLANPQRLERLIPARHKSWIVIDEIQRVPELLNEVHRLIEQKHWRFVLTGSSARKLRRGGTNLLAGRALTYRMHPLAAAELLKDFDLRRSLEIGRLPSVYSEVEPARYLESYVRTYLEEEVRQEGLTRNLAAFARFLEAASFSQGSVLNMTEVARECAVERKVVENYFTILDDMLLAYRVNVFSRRARRRLIAHPKFYFFDAGVYRTLRPSGPLDCPEEIDGAALETLFLQEVLAVNDALDLGYQIYFWRTSNGEEVDFVLYGRRGLLAVEVKRSARYSRKDLSALRAFRRDYPEARTVLVYGGNRKMQEGEIEVLPADAVFAGMPAFLRAK
jgi:predicted AAA+ superfamily ATPase